MTVEGHFSFGYGIGESGALTIVEVQLYGMLGQYHRPYVNLPQSDPWKDDGATQDDDQPEWRCMQKGVSERLTGGPVVVGEQDNLSFNQYP